MGSYNRLARFKAEFLNKFVEEYQITSVIEYGCGDGAQLKLANYPRYTGLDISAKAVEMCKKTFADDRTKQFFQSHSAKAGLLADLTISLDVIYHLVEDPVFDDYMRQLFDSARRFVIAYSTNIDEQSSAPHVRHRQFTRWIIQNRTDWTLYLYRKNDYPFDPSDPEQTSSADFYVFARHSQESDPDR